MTPQIKGFWLWILERMSMHFTDNCLHALSLCDWLSQTQCCLNFKRGYVSVIWSCNNDLIFVLLFFLFPNTSDIRNCLLTENNTIKITDIAMGISLFNSDYSEVRGRSCAPIRWQPWESILLETYLYLLKVSRNLSDNRSIRKGLSNRQKITNQSINRKFIWPLLPCFIWLRYIL